MSGEKLAQKQFDELCDILHQVNQETPLPTLEELKNRFEVTGIEEPDEWFDVGWKDLVLTIGKNPETGLFYAESSDVQFTDSELGTFYNLDLRQKEE
jgi:hypothetical protein